MDTTWKILYDEEMIENYLAYEEEQERQEMRKEAFAQGQREGRKQGREEGREDGIQAMVIAIQRITRDPGQASRALVQDFGLSADVAEAKTRQYWRQEEV